MDVYTACKEGRLNLVRDWISSGKNDVNRKDVEGWTLLHISIYNKEFGIAKLLLDHPDICVLVVNKDLSTPLHFAVKHREQISQEHLDVLNKLKEKGCILNAQQKSGYTPLHEAVDKGHYSTVLWLLENGADMNIQSKKGHTPLHIVAARGNLEMASHLVERGANVNIRDNEGYLCYDLGDSIELKNLLKGFSLNNLTNIGALWDCGQTEVFRGLNYYPNFAKITEHNVFFTIENFCQLFEPIEMGYCITVVPPIMQIAIMQFGEEEKNQRENKKLDVWASCDFCHVIRLLLFSDKEQKYKILAESYSDPVVNPVQVLIQRVNNIKGLLQACKLDITSSSFLEVEDFCNKLESSEINESSEDNWKIMFSAYPFIRRNLLNIRYPHRYPIIMGTDRWKTMFSFMLGIDRLKASLPKDHKYSEFDTVSIEATRNLTFSMYNPLEFKKARKLFAVKEDSFFRALDATTFLIRFFIFCNFVPFGAKNSADGKIFYSADQKYLLREIEKEEFDNYIEFMPVYYNYLEISPNNFLPRYLGLFSVNRGEITDYYISELNIFPKGLGTITEWGKTPLHTPITIGYLKKAQLMEQLEKDITLLNKSGIHDYKLIVGKVKVKKKKINSKLFSENDKVVIISPRKLSMRRNTSYFNVLETEQLFPAVENGILIIEESNLYYFKIAINISEITKQKKLSRIHRVLKKQGYEQEKSINIQNKQSFLKVIEKCLL